MMRYGIPKYRLPRDILDAEITRILDMGITLELNTTVTDIQAELETEYDAARTARRLGASEAVVVYRRTREKMPAHDIEVEEALEEGGLPGAGPRPERRSVRPAERARRYLLRQRGRGRPRPDDRAPGHLRRRRHGAVGATGSYEIDYDYCKGCGLCVSECPPGAIEMEPEPS